jgi:predicted Zn-dependent peptidase
MVSKTVLNNGIRIVSEEIDHVRSVSIGILVESGSRYENNDNNGTAHFIEHMLFKGTKKRTAFEIAHAIDSVGGIMNAATGKEQTSFYIKIPDYRLENAIELLSDIFTGSLFDEEDIKREREVVIQEIRMAQDEPGDYIYDFFEGMFWKEHPLGLPILGSKEKVESFGREALLNFFRSRYRGKNLVVAAAGNYKHSQLVEFVAKAFGSLSNLDGLDDVKAPEVKTGTAILRRELEQAHLIVGAQAPAATDRERHAAFLLNAVLGGSMSSRLFQEIREKRGLAYEIESYLTSYRDAGIMGVYVGTDSANIKETLGLVKEQLELSAAEMISEDELKSAKELLKGNFLLGMENTDNRMTRLARNEIYFGRHITPEEVLANIDEVAREEIRSLAGRMFRSDALAVAALGPVSEEDLAI